MYFYKNPDKLYVLVKDIAVMQRKKEKKLGNPRLEGCKKHEKLSTLMLKPNSRVNLITNTP